MVQVRITRFHDGKREIQYSFEEISGYMPEGVGISLLPWYININIK